jgi:hypothetical protein
MPNSFAIWDLRSGVHKVGGVLIVDCPHCCEECGLPEDDFTVCEIKYMLSSYLECALLIQLYGTGCRNVRLSPLCRDSYDSFKERCSALLWPESVQTTPSY